MRAVLDSHTAKARRREAVERWKTRNPGRQKLLSRESHLRRKYGITAEHFAAMLLEQKGVCASCGQPETRIVCGEVAPLSVDHCHTTDRVRHLLCNDCNTSLGAMGEDENRILALAAYAKRIKETA